MRASIAGRRCVLAGLAAAQLAGVPAQADLARPPCRAVAFSPAYRHDRTVFCYYHSIHPQPTLRFWASTDGMRSWQEKPASGVAIGEGVAVAQLLVSPGFPADRSVHLATSAGLYRSTDLGATFAMSSPLVTSAGRDNLALYVDAGSPVPGAGGGATILYADPTPRDLALRIQSPLHVPVSGSPDHDVRFLLPPGFPSRGVPYVVAERRTQTTAGVRFETHLYRCDPTFTCAEDLWTFPTGHTVYDAQFAPDFPASGRLYVVTSDAPPNDVGTHLWSSADGGRTFTEVPLTTGLARQVRAVGGGGIAMGLAFVSPHRLLLRWSYAPGLGAGTRSTAPPAHQVHRSDDGGRTWRLMGYARGDDQVGPRGSLPWTSSRQYGSGAVNRLTVADGLVVTLGGSLRTGYAGIYCSPDHGRTWRAGC